MGLASIGFAGMGACAKISAADFSTLTVVFARSIVVALAAFVLLRARRLPLRVGNPKLLAWRCLSGFAAMVLYYYALGAVPLAVAVTLQYTAPLFVALLSYVVLRERVTLATTLAIIVAFVGAALVLSPSLTSFEPAAFAALASALLAAFAYLAVRGLRETDPPEIIVLAFALASLLLSAPGLLQIDHLPSLLELLALLGVGVGAAVGQLGMTHAYRYAKAAFISSFSYLTVLISALIGLLWFDEGLEAPLALGALLIVGSGIAVSLSKSGE